MHKTLFIAHGKTPNRGGILIFRSIYEKWPYESELIFPPNYKELLRNILSYKDIKNLEYIVMENEYFSEVLAALILKLRNRKIKVAGPAYHIPPFPSRWKGFFKSIIHYMDYKLGILFSTFFYRNIYTENSYVKNYLKDFNSNANIIVESPGVKLNLIKSFKEIENENRSIDFLYLTSMTEEKGIYDFLEIMRKLNKINDKISFAIAGFAHDDILLDINKFVKNNNIKNITIIPNIKEEEKYELYLKSKIYVLPSKEDGIPITFYEGWAYGDIVISYNLDTFIDIVNYIIPVELGNVEMLADKCIYALTNYKEISEKTMLKNYEYSIAHEWDKGIKYIIDAITEN